MTQEKKYNDENDEAYYPTFSKETNVIFISIIVFIIIWIILGLMAFIMSIVCFNSKSSNFDKVIGLIISSIFGPFYWIFYFSNNNYCKVK